MPAQHDKLKGKVQAHQLVEFDGVDFSYGANSVLRNLSIDFPRGKLVAIMGGSGSGKTTLLRLIGGQIRAQKGSVRFDGEEVSSMSHARLYAARRRMGMLFQFGALFTDLSVFENVAFPIREHLRLPEAMVRDLVLMKLHAVGLRGAHELKPAELSGGMARRVALARAIALDPQLIMYDEPFAGLDPISMAVIANLIRRLNSALGATSIVVTHDVAESFKIVDYVCFLSRGQIVAQGTPEQMRTSNEPYVRQFVEGHMDGPVRFHYPAASYDADLGLGG
ncbi:MAG: ABC transporter ATP-binding protein [Betaproteobacteria bacterium]|nr:MAG: ABC transporter ATP-binding protein [Betaproteobacteria bacterium]